MTPADWTKATWDCAGIVPLLWWPEVAIGLVGAFGLGRWSSALWRGSVVRRVCGRWM